MALAIVALHPDSAIERRLHRLGRAGGRARLGAAMGDRLPVRVTSALACALAACFASATLSIGILPIGAAAYAGWIAPALASDHARRGERVAAEHAVVTLVEWLHALVSSGRPLETALVTVADRTRGTSLFDTVLARTVSDYTLGVPLHRALGRHAAEARIEGLVDLAARVDRARDLGRGALPLLADLRDDLRARERARALAAASAVEGKLTAILTLCYLPALALLVIVPLFLTLLAGLLT